MLASKLACGHTVLTCLSRPTVFQTPKTMIFRVQMYASETRSGLGRFTKRKTLKETLMAPASETRKSTKL